MKRHALIIGCGLVGSVIARYLVEECDFMVSIWERRNHIGGNLYDYTDEHNIRVQKYGPHIFHTNSAEIYEYISRFAIWEPYNLTCGAVIDDICSPTAFNFKTIDLFYPPEKAQEIKQHICVRYPNQESATVLELLESDDQIIREYAQFLYEKDYSLYTAKQWGIHPTEIDKSILKRVPIRFSYDEAYFKDKYQVMPKNGYTDFVQQILDHPQISIELNKDVLSCITVKNNTIFVNGVPIDYPLIYTGPLDEFFSFKNGRLPYRSLWFEWKYDTRESLQEYPVVAYPQARDFTRITEYKKLPRQDVSGTSYAIEYPIPYNSQAADIEPYYPILTEASQDLHGQYLRMVQQIENFYCCGRLADFKYYDMDKAIECALAFCKNFHKKE